MRRPPSGATRLRRCAHALVLSLLLLAGAPARAAVSPYPPIALGNVTVGSSLQADVVVPLTMAVSQIPSAYDAQVVFTSGNASEDLLLAAAGLTSPVTVAQLKLAHPTWSVSIPVPAAALDNPSGMYSLSSLGCDASQCTYRATYAPTAPGVHTAQLSASIASITFNEGGLLGVIANLFAPLLLGIVNAALVFDFTGTGVAVPVAAPAAPVPADGVAWLGALAATLAAAGTLALRRRSRR